MKENQKKIKERKNEKKKKHKILRFLLKTILIIILLFILFLGGFVGYSVYKNGWGWKSLLQTAVGQSDEKLQELEEFRVLILGISEDISVELTDTIMVASYNPRTQKASLLSIPRDTFIGSSKLSATSYDKINALYQQGGAEATLEKVNEITGLDIEYYIVINNNALVDLVDAIGGVEFYVPMDMDYDSENQDLHIHLEEGLQTLTGEQAEWLVRFRKNNDGTTYSSDYGSDDYGRMRTQREFLKAVAEQTLQLKNITKISELIDVVKDNISTNITNWSVIKDYIPYALEFDLDNLQTETLPGVSDRIPSGTGLWFFIYDEEETEELIQEMFLDLDNEEDTTTSQSTLSSDLEEEKASINIEVLNGSGRAASLTEAVNLLKENGYNVYKTDTTTTISRTTIVNNSSVNSDIPLDIKSILGAGIISSSSENSSVIDITIILGSDYNQ